MSEAEKEIHLVSSFYERGFWAATAFSVALLLGQYTPNRNIVTQDQMTDFRRQITALSTSVESLNKNVAYLTGVHDTNEKLSEK